MAEIIRNEWSLYWVFFFSIFFVFYCFPIIVFLSVINLEIRKHMKKIHEIKHADVFLPGFLVLWNKIHLSKAFWRIYSDHNTRIITEVTTEVNQRLSKYELPMLTYSRLYDCVITYTDCWLLIPTLNSLWKLVWSKTGKGLFIVSLEMNGPLILILC